MSLLAHRIGSLRRTESAAIEGIADIRRSLFEYGISAKWLELLKEISPGLKRAAVLRAPNAVAFVDNVTW